MLVREFWAYLGVISIKGNYNNNVKTGVYESSIIYAVSSAPFDKFYPRGRSYQDSACLRLGTNLARVNSTLYLWETLSCHRTSLLFMDLGAKVSHKYSCLV